MAVSGAVTIGIPVLAAAIAAAAVVQLARVSGPLAALEARVAGLEKPAAASPAAVPVSVSEREALRRELDQLRAELNALRTTPAPAGGDPDPKAWENAVEAVLQKKKLENAEKSAARFSEGRMKDNRKEIDRLCVGLKIEGDQLRQVEEALRAGYHQQGYVLAAQQHPEGVGPEIERIREQTVASVRALLTAEQAERFDKAGHDWFPGPGTAKAPRR